MLVPLKEILVIGEGKYPLIVSVDPAAAVEGDSELTDESWLFTTGVPPPPPPATTK